MARRMTCVLLLTAGLAAWLGTAARAADDVLTLVPDDAWAFGVIRNIGEANANLQKLGQKVGAPIPDMLAELKDNVGIEKGLDTKGAAAVIILAGKTSKEDPHVVIAVPVSNYDQLLESLKPEKKGSERLAKVEIGGEDVLVAQRGNFALFASVKRGKAALEKVLDSKKSVAGQLGGLESWIAEQDGALVATSAGVKAFSEKAAEELKKVRDIVAGTEELPQQQNVAVALEVYDRILKAADKEIAAAGVGIRADQQINLYYDARARFKPEGQVAKLLANLKPGEGNPLAGLPGGAFVFAAGGPLPESLWEPMMQFSSAIMKQANKVYGLTPEQIDKLIEASRGPAKMMKGMAVEMKIGKRGEPIYSNIFGTIRATDAQCYLADYQKQIQATNELLKNAKEGLMKPMKVEKREIGGKPALEVEMTIAIPKPAAEVPNFDEMMEKFLGAGGKAKVYLVAADEHNVVFGFNTTQEAVAKAMEAVTEPKSSLASDPDMAKIAAMLPKGAQWAAYISPRGVVAFGLRIFATFAPEEFTAKIPPFPKTPPVGVAVKASASEGQLEVVVPDTVLEALGKYIKQVSQQDRPEVP